jgi:pseudaminic acid cytidylyltransferase
MQQQNNIAIIPARGGSKRIPKKNIKSFNGKPIIAYSIQAALNSGLFEEIMVSTDDQEIAEVAKQYGAKVPFMRSTSNADDYATTIDVLLEVYDKYSSIGIKFEHVCCIYACAPFVTVNKLKESLNMLKDNKASTVFPIIQYSHPIQRAFEKIGGTIKMIDESNLFVRTQDLPPRFHDAGQFYWLTSESLLTDKKLATNKTTGIVINESEAQDIDSEVDWGMAELKYNLLIKNNSYLR